MNYKENTNRIFDYVGTLRARLNESLEQIASYDFMPYVAALDKTEAPHLAYIYNEKDRESKLGDHGVRKYDYEIGRFTSVDPLWEKYTGWTGYHYTRNNPINRIDFSGFAEYITNYGILNDSYNDGQVYLSFKSEVENSVVNHESGYGPPKLDYSLLKTNSTLLPNKKVRNEISEQNESYPTGESGGVGGQGFYKHGGRNRNKLYGNYTGTAKDEVFSAVSLCNNDEKNKLQYYIHSHPWLETSGRPSDPGDYDAFPVINSKFGIGIHYGILFFKEDVFFFNQNKEQIKVTLDTFNSLGE